MDPLLASASSLTAGYSTNNPSTAPGENSVLHRHHHQRSHPQLETYQVGQTAKESHPSALPFKKSELQNTAPAFTTTAISSINSGNNSPVTNGQKSVISLTDPVPPPGMPPGGGSVVTSSSAGSTPTLLPDQRGVPASMQTLSKQNKFITNMMLSNQLHDAGASPSFSSVTTTPAPASTLPGSAGTSDAAAEIHRCASLGVASSLSGSTVPDEIGLPSLVGRRHSSTGDGHPVAPAPMSARAMLGVHAGTGLGGPLLDPHVLLRAATVGSLLPKEQRDPLLQEQISLLPELLGTASRGLVGVPPIAATAAAAAPISSAFQIDTDALALARRLLSTAEAGLVAPPVPALSTQALQDSQQVHVALSLLATTSGAGIATTANNTTSLSSTAFLQSRLGTLGTAAQATLPTVTGLSAPPAAAPGTSMTSPAGTANFLESQALHRLMLARRSSAMSDSILHQQHARTDGSKQLQQHHQLSALQRHELAGLPIVPTNSIASTAPGPSIDAVQNEQQRKQQQSEAVSSTKSWDGIGNPDIHLPESFPVKLHRILCELEKVPGGTNIACFLPHGRAFMIRDIQMFEASVMKKYYRRMSRFASFQRQLNLYDFQRIHKGIDKGAYHHKLFVKQQPARAKRMRRTKIKGENSLRNPNNKNALNQYKPINFYSMKPPSEDDDVDDYDVADNNSSNNNDKMNNDNGSHCLEGNGVNKELTGTVGNEEDNEPNN